MTATAGGDALSKLMAAALSQLDAASRLRRLSPRDFGPLRPATAGELDLTHNDYLGLRQDPELLARIRAGLGELPVGAGGSRLLGGEHPLFGQLEREFAAFKGCAESLYFPSGYAANEGVASSLARLPGVRFFSDALNHASLIDGIRLGALPKTARQVFAHNDTADLERRLAASDGEINVIFCESVYSMDGDLAPLAALGALARQYRGVLVVDEAHALMVSGAMGRGLAAEAGLADDALITVNTCGKGLGVGGALVGLSAVAKQYLINTARSLIYTTAPSPWLAHALQESLVYGAGLQTRRQTLLRSAETVRQVATAAGFSTGQSQTQIIPLLCGTDRRALELSAALGEHGILARAIRPPTVPEGQARVRLSLNTEVQGEGLERLLAALKSVGQAWQ